MSTESIKYVVDLAGNMDKKLTEIIAQQKILNSEFDKTKKKANEVGESMKTGGKFDSMKSGIAGVRNTALLAAAAVAGIGYAMLSLAKQNAGLEQNNRALLISSGSSAEYLKNIEFLSEMQRKFGTNIETSRQGLMSFSASTKGTALQGDKTRKIFQAVTQASGALGLSAEKQGLTFMALSQIASKGVVSMEELRGQLGESLPGALQVAARSMGMTTAEFQKLVGEGKLLSTEFLPKFAEELQKTFSGGFDPDSMTNVLTKWDNAWKTMAETAGSYFKTAMSAAAEVVDNLANKTKISANETDIRRVLVQYSIDRQTLGRSKIADEDIKDYYKKKYGEDITKEGNRKLERKLYQTDVLPKMLEQVMAQKNITDNARGEYVEAEKKKQTGTVFFRFGHSPENRYENYIEELNKYKKELYLYESYKKQYGEDEKSITPKDEKPLTDTKKIEDKFGGTTITARAPQTFNIHINELIGVNELNNITSMKEAGTQSGNAVLEELMKAVAQVQMIQGN